MRVNAITIGFRRRRRIRAKSTYLAVINDGDTVGWFDSQDLTTITKTDPGNLVSAWNDKLASGHNLLQAGADALNPLWSANGILFDGADDFMKCATFAFIQPEMIYIVFKQITWTNQDRFFDGNALNSGMLRQNGVTPQIAAYAGAASALDANLALNTFGIVRILFNGVNSSLQVDDNAAWEGDLGAANMAGFALGGDATPTSWGHIQVKEVVLRKVADSAGDEAAIYAYLAAKYEI